MGSIDILLMVLIVLMGVYGIVADRVSYISIALILFIGYVFGAFLIA